MKLKRILALLLALTLVLCALPTAVFAQEEQKEEEQTAVAAEEAVTEITGTSLSVDSDLAIKYHVSIAEADKDKAVSMKFTTAKGTSTVSDFCEQGGKRVFTFDGIGPHEVGILTDAELIVDGAVVDTKADYSVEEYCKDALALYPTDNELIALISDLIVYAKAAEMYKNGESTVGGDITIAPTGTLPTSQDDKMVVDGNEDDSLFVYAAGVKFDSMNRVFFKISAASDDFTVALEGKTYTGAELEVGEDGRYIVYSDAIYATDFANTLTVTLKDGDGAGVASVTYSPDTYAYHMMNDEKMGELAKAVYAYGKSCETYVNPVLIYHLNEGTNPPDVPEKYDIRGGTVLPAPTKSGYVFAGWYASEDFSGERIIKTAPGTKRALNLYAKWNLVIYENDYTGASFNYTDTTKNHSHNSITYTLNTKTGTYARTEIDVYDNTYAAIYSTAASDPAVNSFVKLKDKFIAGGSKITFTIDLATHPDGTGSGSDFRIRGNYSGDESWRDIVSIFTTTNNAINVGGKQIATLSTVFTSIAVTLDAKAGTITAYNTETGEPLVTKTGITKPSVSSHADLESWVENNNYLFNWQINKAENGGLSFDNICIYIGDYAGPDKQEMPEGYNYKVNYNANGGNLTSVPSIYANAGDPLPTASNGTFTFGGWYTSPKFEGEPLTEIPAGAPKEFTLYAKWTGTVFKADFSDAKSITAAGTTGGIYFGLKTNQKLELCEADGNKYVTYTKTAEADTYIRTNDLYFTGAGYGKITFTVDLAKAGDATPSSYFKLRGKVNQQLELFSTTADGKVKLTGGAEICTLSDTFTTVVVTVDTVAENVTAYTPDGTKIASANLTVPSKAEADSFVEYIITAECLFYWYFDTAVAGSLAVDNINIYLGEYTPAA